MESETTSTWTESNQAFLVAALREVRDLLQERCRDLGLDSNLQTGDFEPAAAGRGTDVSPVQHGRDALATTYREDTDRPPALVALSQTLRLSSFERRLLLLCAGVELDSSLAALCARLQAGAPHPWPTFSLALSLFPDAHWSALSPAAPLRYWRLIQADREPSLTTCPLRIDERILHYLTGIDYADERLWGTLRSWRAEAELPASHQALAAAIAQACSSPAATPAAVIELSGGEKQSKRDVAALACEQLSLGLYVVSVPSVPGNLSEMEALARLWGREALLARAALLVEPDETESPETARASMLKALVEQTGITIISAPTRREYDFPTRLSLEVKRPTQSEQRELWAGTVANAQAAPVWLDSLASQFNLDSARIRAATAEALMNTNGGKTDPGPENLHGALWNACRNQARFRLDDLAMRIEPAATWDDLVLPRPQLNVLRNIAVHLRQRVRVYGAWGFASKSKRGLGISALFVGESGTGKTLAAEVLANELRLDLYRIDLSQVVSKFIGETEKNLRRVFDAAEDGGAILLFDEADALFGKRSEVKDSHDRYANIEVSYLLQRMEAYRGLAILTTNMKSSLDPAFLRRLRFVVHFPFPDAGFRAEIWGRVFPDETPTDNLDFAKLAKLNVTGGNIRNIAMNAAFLAAEAGTAVRMSHLLDATRTEYAKLEKPLMDSEIGGWV